MIEGNIGHSIQSQKTPSIYSVYRHEVTTLYLSYNFLHDIIGTPNVCSVVPSCAKQQAKARKAAFTKSAIRARVKNHTQRE